MRTTIQISDSMRKRLRLLASRRDISYEDLLEDMIGVFQNNVPFKNEGEVCEWFEDNLAYFGFKKILKRQKASSPDYIVEDKNGDEKGVEIELVGEDFRRHGHDPKKTDLIICLYSTEKTIDGVPVLPIVEPLEKRKALIQKRDIGHTTVSIPMELGEKINKKIKGTGFRSTSEYVIYILRTMISSAEMREDSKGFVKEDIEEVKKRLKSLGYI